MKKKVTWKYSKSQDVFVKNEEPGEPSNAAAPVPATMAAAEAGEPSKAAAPVPAVDLKLTQAEMQEAAAAEREVAAAERRMEQLLSDSAAPGPEVELDEDADVSGFRQS